MLNMLDTQDKLKNFSEQQLIKEMQMPTGSAPQFMVLGEIERRKRMRADVQRQEGLMQPTVAQEAVSAAGVPQQGIAQIAQSMAPQTDMTQNTGALPMQGGGLPGQPQRMASGGVVKLAPGGALSALAQQSSALATDPEIIRAASQSSMTVDEYISMLPPEIRAERLNMLTKDQSLGRLRPVGTGADGYPQYEFVAPFNPEGAAVADREELRQAEESILRGEAPEETPVDQSMLDRARNYYSSDTFTPPEEIYNFGANSPLAGMSDSEEFASLSARSSADRQAMANAKMSDAQERDDRQQIIDRARQGTRPRTFGDPLEIPAEGVGALLPPLPPTLNPEMSVEEALSKRPGYRIGDSIVSLVNPPATEPNYADRFRPEMSVEEALSKRPGYRPGDDIPITGYGGQSVEELQRIINDPTSSPGEIRAAQTRLGTAQGVGNTLQVVGDFLAPGGPGEQLISPTLDMGANAIAGLGVAGNAIIDAGGRVVSLANPELGANILDYTDDNKEVFDDLATRFEFRASEPDYADRFDPEAGFIPAYLGDVPPSVQAAPVPAVDQSPEGIETLLPDEVSPLAPDTGTPSSGTPSSGTPSSGTPSSGTPSSGTPSSGTPSSGASDDEAPASGSNMDQDKWLALAQAGFTLMSTGDFGKAGQAGLAAYSQSKQAAQDARKLEAELAFLDARTQAALRPPRGGNTRPAVADLNYAQGQLTDLQEALDSLPPIPTPGIFGGTPADPYALQRTELTNARNAARSKVRALEALRYGETPTPTTSSGVQTVDVRDN